MADGLMFTDYRSNRQMHEELAVSNGLQADDNQGFRKLAESSKGIVFPPLKVNDPITNK